MRKKTAEKTEGHPAAAPLDADAWRLDRWETRLLRRSRAVSELGGVSLAGLLRGSPGIGLHSRPMRVFGQYAIVYLVGGGGVYRDANGLERPVTPGDLIWVFPDLAHAYGPLDGAGWDEIYLCFHGPVFDLWMGAGLIDPRSPIWRLEPIDYWLSRFRWVLSGGLRGAGGARPLMEVCRLQQVLAEARLLNGSGAERRLELAAIRGSVAAQFAGDAPAVEGDESDDARWIERACALLDADLARGARPRAGDAVVRDAADATGMSYEAFRKRFSRLTGSSPGRYRSARVMDRACELMQERRLTDKQIALALGFCDEFHFSRRFKSVVGFSPREFRRRVT